MNTIIMMPVLWLAVFGWARAGIVATDDVRLGPLWAACTLTVLLYVTAVLGFLYPSAWLLVAGGGIYGVYAAIRARAWRQRTWQIGAGLLTLVFVLAWSHSTGMRFFAWDEFSHWGLQLKFLATDNRLQTDNAVLLFPDYIPGLSLYRYLSSLFFSTQEAGYHFFNWMMVYAGLLAITSTGPSKNGMPAYQSIAIVLIGFAGYVLFFQSLVLTVYVDPLQGLLLLVAFAVAFNESRLERRVATLAPIVVMIVLTKHVGIIFAAMTIGLLVVLDAIRSLSTVRSRLGQYIVLALLSVSAYLSWSVYVNWHGLNKGVTLLPSRMPSNFSEIPAFWMSSIAAVLDGRFPHAAYYAAVPWMQAATEHGRLWHAIVLASTIMALMTFLLKPADRKAHGIVCLYFAACLTAYVAFLGFILGLTPWINDVWSFSRYTSVLLFAILIVAMVQVIRRTPKRYTAVLLFSLLAVGNCLTLPLYGKLFSLAPRPSFEPRISSDALASIVHEKIPAEATAWYVYDPDDGYRYYLNRYTFYPVTLLGPQVNADWVSRESLTQEELADAKLTLEDALRQVDYVIVDKPATVFRERYAEYLSDMDHIVYRVLRDSQGNFHLQGM